MTKKQKITSHADKKPQTARKCPARYEACMPKKLGAVRDPAAPPKGEPRPIRGIGSRASEAMEKPLTWHGHTMSRAAWARYLRISRSTLAYRLRHYPVEMALDPDFRSKMISAMVANGTWPRRRKAVSAATKATLKPKTKKPVGKKRNGNRTNRA